MSESRVHEVAGTFSSGTTMPHGLDTGRSKYYPSNSARTLLKECFAVNPPVRLDPHQQLTGMSADQEIQFARAIGLEISHFWNVGGRVVEKWWKGWKKCW